MESKDFDLDRKLTKTEIYQGILLLLSIAALITCAGIRGCQEVKKHMKKTENKQVISHKTSNFPIPHAINIVKPIDGQVLTKTMLVTEIEK